MVILGIDGADDWPAGCSTRRPRGVIGGPRIRGSCGAVLYELYDVDPEATVEVLF
jgi:hypothetical protein